MGKFRQDASELLKEVGGKENITGQCIVQLGYV